MYNYIFNLLENKEFVTQVVATIIGSITTFIFTLIYLKYSNNNESKQKIKNTIDLLSNLYINKIKLEKDIPENYEEYTKKYGYDEIYISIYHYNEFIIKNNTQLHLIHKKIIKDFSSKQNPECILSINCSPRNSEYLYKLTLSDNFIKKCFNLYHKFHPNKKNYKTKLYDSIGKLIITNNHNNQRRKFLLKIINKT